MTTCSAVLTCAEPQRSGAQELRRVTGEPPETSATRALAAAEPSASRQTPRVDGCEALIDASADHTLTRKALAEELGEHCVRGMRRLPTEVTTSADPQASFSVRVSDAEGCLRILAVAETGARQLTVRLLLEGKELERVERSARFAWLGADGPLCVSRAGDYRVVVSSAPASPVHVDVWQAL